MATPQTCPSNAITSFPLSLSSAPTQSAYDSVDEPITMNVAFAPRATAPVFANPTVDGTLDEGSSGNSGSPTTNTIVFNNTTYNLSSVQIASNPASSTSGATATGTHYTWLLDQSVTNTEDVIFIFSAPNSVAVYKYIVIVVPIIRSGTTSPPYLQAIASGSVAGTVSIRDCMPSDKRAQFAYYSTCLNGYSDYAETQQIYVLVSISGINASSADMAKIQTARGAGGFNSPATPFGTRLSNTKTSINVNEFSNYILTTTWLLDSAEYSGRNPAATPTRTDSTNAYKCTQLNPDRDIANGQLQVDMATGNLLTDILAERQAVITTATGGSTASTGANRTTKYLNTALGILCAIIFSVIFLYFLYYGGSAIWRQIQAWRGVVVVAAPAPTTDVMGPIATYGLTAVLCAFVGLMVGLNLG